MITCDAREYDYYKYGASDEYGQNTVPTKPTGKIKMSIYISAKNTQDNILYEGATYLGITHDKSVDSDYIIAYNNELSLSVTLALAYYSARKQYEIIREFPSGEGFADLAFIPRKGVNAPAIVAELKYDKSAEGAISQIKGRNYTDKLTAFSGEILLVGINYDKESKRHECQIEKVIK